MDRAQTIAHLTLLGWVPYGRNGIVSKEHGSIGRYSDGTTYWSANNMSHSIGFTWDDINDIVLVAVMMRLNTEDEA